MIRYHADPSQATTAWCERIAGDVERCRVLAIGKAGATMMRAASEVFDSRVLAGLVIAPDSTIDAARLPETVSAVASDHPRPTARSETAAREARRFIAAGDGPLVVLLSGGGSAMVAEPIEGVTLDDIIAVSDRLMRSGASIDELNALRKRLDRTKGGGLGLATAGRRTLVGVVSDVIGDRLDVVSSGPFFGDHADEAEAVRVLDRYGVEHAAVRAAAASPETRDPRPDDPRLQAIEHEVLTSNRVVVGRVAAEIERELRLPVRVHADLTGEAASWGRRLADELAHAPGCVVLGGESVVADVPPGASGGPVQEAVLAAGAALASQPDWLVVGFATDGIDGPTDAAGGVLSPATLPNPDERARALSEHRSFDALDRAGALLRTGPTGTNVNDVLVGIRLSEGRAR